MGERKDYLANLRVDAALWREFVRVCQERDTTASRELRRVVREHVERARGQEQAERHGVRAE